MKAMSESTRKQDMSERAPVVDAVPKAGIAESKPKEANCGDYIKAVAHVNAGREM